MVPVSLVDRTGDLTVRIPERQHPDRQVRARMSNEQADRRHQGDSMSTDRSAASTETKPRRLTSTKPVAMPSSTRRILAPLAYVLGLAAALLGGANTGLAITLSLVVLVASLLLGRLRDRSRAIAVPITLVSVASVPMITSGAPNIWIILAFAGAAFFGQTIGTALRARQEAREAIILPTDPASVPGRTVLLWRMGREQFEVLDPSEKRLRTVIKGPKGNIPTSIELRRGTAGLDILRPGDVPIAVLHAMDVDTGPWYEIVDPIVAPGPGQPIPANPSTAVLLDRATEAAVHFSRTGEPSPSAPWALSTRR